MFPWVLFSSFLLGPLTCAHSLTRRQGFVRSLPTCRFRSELYWFLSGWCSFDGVILEPNVLKCFRCACESERTRRFLSILACMCLLGLQAIAVAIADQVAIQHIRTLSTWPSRLSPLPYSSIRHFISHFKFMTGGAVWVHAKYRPHTSTSLRMGHCSCRLTCSTKDYIVCRCHRSFSRATEE